ncbi:MAG: DUF2169 domain-containing protein [Rhizobacter sp.]
MIQNLTPFAAEVFPCHSTTGQTQCLVVVKATLDLAGQVVSQGQGLPICRGDEYFNLDGFNQVIRFESDMAQVKPMVDVIVNAWAHAPGGKPIPEFAAGVRVGNESRVLQVSGKRHWHRRLGVIPTMSKPEPTLCVPVIYPLAYGGEDRGDAMAFWDQNPSGQGFSSGLPYDGLLLPQIEWADDLIDGPGHPKTVAGLGCYGRTWLPRRSFLGSYGTEELKFKGVATKMPETFDPRSWNCAHPRMQFASGSVVAGTEIELVNLSPSGRVRLVVPDIGIAISWSAKGQYATIRPAFDTVTIEPEAGPQGGHMALTWRHTVQNVSLETMDAVKVQFV